MAFKKTITKRRLQGIKFFYYFFLEICIKIIFSDLLLNQKEGRGSEGWQLLRGWGKWGGGKGKGERGAIFARGKSKRTDSAFLKNEIIDICLRWLSVYFSELSFLSIFLSSSKMSSYIHIFLFLFCHFLLKRFFLLFLHILWLLLLSIFIISFFLLSTTFHILNSISCRSVCFLFLVLIFLSFFFSNPEMSPLQLQRGHF